MAMLRLIPVIVIALTLAVPAAQGATIYKCRGPHGHWRYSERKPTQCRGHFLVLGIPGAPKAAPPRVARPAARRPRPPNPPTAHWRQTLSALKKTPIPHNPGEARLRQQAVLLLESRLAETQGGVPARAPGAEPP